MTRSENISVASVQWGDGFRRLMGYHDQNDFPNEMESFLRGIHPEDRDAEHKQSMQIDIFDGYAVYSIKGNGREKNNVTEESSSGETSNTDNNTQKS